MFRSESLEPLAAVLSWAGTPLDSRGLLPLDEARRIVGSVSEYRFRADPFPERPDRMHGDVLWAALLSLETATEFSREAKRLRWVDGPRGLDGNVDPFMRFGDEVLAWVVACTSPSGDLDAAPSNLPNCLLQVGTAEAFAAAGRVRTIGGDPEPARCLRDEWIRRHAELAVRIASRDVPLSGAWSRDDVLARAADAGNAEASRLLARRRTPGGVTADAVLRELDRGFALFERGEVTWPIFGLFDHYPTHGMRLVAAVMPGTGRWAVAIQGVCGNYPEMVAIDSYTYGSAPRLGWDISLRSELGLTEDPPDALNDPRASVTLSSRLGTTTAGPAELDDPSLVPVGYDSREHSNVAHIRRYLRAHRTRLWPPAAPLMEHILGSGSAVIVADTDAFHHRDDVPPSEQPTYVSLAEAIEHADPSRFVGGEPNTWFDTLERRSSDG